MKRLLPALAGIVMSAAAAGAQLAPVRAGVFHWAALAPTDAGGGRVERLVLSGSTLDLDALEVRAITMPAREWPDTTAAQDSLESFVLVKDGRLMATLNGVIRTLGAGGVALVLPGDRLVLTNLGGAPATYYRFTYRSREPMNLERGRQAGGSFMLDYTELTEKPTAVGFRRDVLNRPTAMFRRFESHWSSVRAGVVVGVVFALAVVLVVAVVGRARVVVGFCWASERPDHRTIDVARESSNRRRDSGIDRLQSRKPFPSGPHRFARQNSSCMCRAGSL